jgi:hypothetical protein
MGSFKPLELRQQIERDLARLNAEQLAQVRDFLASLQLERTASEREDDLLTIAPRHSMRRAAPIRRGFQAKDVLELAGTWVGDDLDECLEIVRQDRSMAQF